VRIYTAVFTGSLIMFHIITVSPTRTLEHLLVLLGSPRPTYVWIPYIDHEYKQPPTHPLQISIPTLGKLDACKFRLDQYYANKLGFAYWQDDTTKQMMRGDANIIAYMSWKE